MFPLALQRTSIRAAAVALLLAVGIAGASPAAFAPADTGKPVVLEGQLDVRIEDYPDGHSRLRHFLKTSQGRVELTFAHKAMQHLSSGTRVRVHGQVQGNMLALDGSTGSVEVLAKVLPNTMGEQSIAVLLVNFQDDASQPKSLAEARNLVFGENCSSIEYGDAADLMGNGRAGHFGPFAKELLGWLNDGISPPITTVTTSGRYSIEPYPAASVGPKALKIPLGTDVYGRKTWYYLEYRQPIGGDSVLATTGNLTKGVIVRYAVEGDGDTGFQLDMSPGSSTNKFDEMADGALAVGQSYFEESIGVTMTLASTSSTDATLDVVFGPTCLRAKPTVSVTGGGTAVKAGSTVGYTVTVTNRDSAGCAGSTTFTLWNSVPVGWANTLATTTMTLLPGASASVPLGVTSTATAAPGSYNIVASVSSPLGSRHASNNGAIYAIVDPAIVCMRGAPTLSLAGGGTPVAAGTTVGYTLALTNRDSSACAATTFTLAKSVPTGWAGTFGKPSMTLAPGATASTTLGITSTATTAPGRYGIGAAAASPSGALHTVNASATYTAAPTLSIADASVVVGNAGTAMAGSDYAALSLAGQSIPAGSTSKTFNVGIAGDAAVEADESFLVNVSGVKGATVADAQAVGTIRNDDTVLSIADATVAEGNSGTKTLAFAVKLSAPSANPVTFNLATANSTAAAGSDYIALALSGQSIPAGSTLKVFNVTINGDIVREVNETFVLNVRSVMGAVIGDAQAVGTIANDD